MNAYLSLTLKMSLFQPNPAPVWQPRSVLLLPLFADPSRTAVAGVVEIVQASTTMPFTNMVEVLSDAFKVGLPPGFGSVLPDLDTAGGSKLVCRMVECSEETAIMFGFSLIIPLYCVVHF